MIIKRASSRLLALGLFIVTGVPGATQASAQGTSSTRPCGPQVSSGVVLVFVNGVGNSQADAEANCTALAAALTSWGLGTHQVEFFYNTSASYSAPCISLATGARTLITGFRGSGTNCFEDIQPPDLVEARLQIFNVARNFPDRSQPDARRLGEAINQHLRMGRSVVVIAHSQGNLLFQEAVFGREQIVSSRDWPSVGWMSVAPPYLASSPRLGGFHAVIFAQDILIAGPVLLAAGATMSSAYLLGKVLADQGSFLSTVRAAQHITGLGTTADPIASDELSGFLKSHKFSTYLTDAAGAAEIDSGLRRILSTISPPADHSSATRVLLVLDLSGSMNQRGKLDAAKNAAFAALDRIPPATTVDLVAFGGSCGVSLSAGFNANRDSARQAIANLSASGETPLADAIDEVTQRVLASGNPGAFHVIVISDGEETCGGNWERAARRLGEALELVRIP